MPRNERLRQQRLLRHWRLRDLADQLGTTITTVNRWERGVQQPRAYYRVRLCALFDLTAQELGFNIEAADVPSSEQPPLTEPTQACEGSVEEEEKRGYWTVPYARNPNFTGREALLANLLHQYPRQETERQTDQPSLHIYSLALTGLGGIGKTQLAIEYAYRVRELEPATHIVWINAANEEALLASFLTLTKLIPALHTHSDVDLHAQVRACLRWLEQSSTQLWVLIYDNADDLLAISAYLPHRGNGRILLTTRMRAVGALAIPIEVENMSIEEATRFLLQRAQRLADAQPSEIEAAQRLATTLAQFPLALDQAGAYVEETGCGFGTYLDLYQGHRGTLLARRGTQVTDYPDSVTTTWSISFARLAQHNPATQALLHLCAFLTPDHIPEELLTEGAACWPPVLQQSIADLFRFNQLLQDLHSFSFIKRQANKQMLSLHRLVQLVQKDQLSAEEQRCWAQRVVQAIHLLFPPNPKDACAWPRCRRLLEQAKACEVLIREYHLSLPEAADLLDRVSVYLREHASYQMAEPWLQWTLQYREQLEGSQHPSVAASLNNLAMLYRGQRKHTEAEALLQRALAIRESHLGSHHLDTAQIQHNLALVMKAQGHYEQAEPLYRHALAIAERELGLLDDKTMICLENLADLYVKQHRYREAEDLREHLLLRWEQRAPSSQRRAGSCSCHAQQGTFSLPERNQSDEPRTSMKPFPLRALALWKKHYGKENALLPYYLQGLAELLIVQGKHAYARAFLCQAWMI
jgi:transcriptional regulator with XRE-family HTH domain